MEDMQVQEITQNELQKDLTELPFEEKESPLVKPPKKRKKYLKWVLIVLAVLAAVWFLFLRPKGTAPAAGPGQYTVAPMSIQDLVVAVSGSGAVTPIESYQVSALASGEILDAPFEVGDWIEAGDLLYQLDPSEAQTAIQQAELALRQAQLAYSNLAAGLKPSAAAAGVVQKVHVQTGDLVSPGTPIADIADTSTMTLELPFHSADAALLAPGQPAHVTIAGTLEELPGTVESISSADLVGAGGTLIRQVKIRVSNPGALTSSSSGTAVVGDIACAGSGNFVENSRQTVAAQASGQITAVNVTAGSKVSADTVLAVIGGDTADSSLANAAISVENAQLSLQRAQDALKDYTITSPISGTVIEKNFKAGDKINGMETGSLAIIYDMSSLKLTINVSELNFNQIQAGQAVEITAEALPGQVFQGVVDRVSINGTTTNGFTTYPVTILLKEFGTLNPGMNVSADIIAEQAKDVPCIPVAAVNSDGTVLVAAPGTLTEDGTAVADLSKAEVCTPKLGRSAGDYIEVLSGIEEGDVVLIPVQATGGMGAAAMGG